MSFISDRDLLALEPNLFRDIPVLGQERVNVTDGVVSGTTLTSAAADFTLAAVDVGSVLMVAGLCVEVVTRQDANTLTVSRLRTHDADPPIPPGDGAALAVVARTFAPQIELAHANLMRLMGIDADAELTETSIVSLDQVERLEALGTLEQVYGMATAVVGDNAGVSAKAENYRRQSNRAWREAIVLLDHNGDGHAQTRRRPGVGWFKRV